MQGAIVKELGEVSCGSKRKKKERKMLEETYADWSARAISELAALSNFPTETIYSRFGVVIVEGMTYVESTLAMLL